MRKLAIIVALAWAGATQAGITPEEIDQAAAAVQPQVVEWRRWFHQNPELSNREFNTAKYISEALTEMGIEHRTGIAGTGSALDGGPGSSDSTVSGTPAATQTPIACPHSRLPLKTSSTSPRASRPGSSSRATMAAESLGSG